MISIVTAYYNRKCLFERTLESIDKSTYKDVEVIAVDDCSDEDQRLEDLITRYPFLKIIRLDRDNKWYTNPCVPFNIGFKKAIGEIVIIQNPECYHGSDILEFTACNLQIEDYFSYSCYSLDQETTNNFDHNKSISFANKAISYDGESGWYNHSVYRPVGYHFCSAIHKSQLDELGGFDERYALGIAFDDNEFVHRVNKKGLNFNIIDTEVVYHQWHYTKTNYQQPNTQALVEHNRNLFYNHTMLQQTWKVNQ